MRLRWGIGVVLLVGAAYFAVFGGDYDIFELRQVRAELETEQVRLDEVRAEVARLEARVDSLENDSATIERIAREKWGMIRPGEKLYRFEDAVRDSAQDTSAVH